MRYLDANVFIRYATEDDIEKALAAQQLFNRVARGEERVALLEVTVAEVVFVLGSKALYAMSHQDIADRLRALLTHRNVQMSHKGRCLHALDLFAEHQSLSFGDAMICAAALDEDEAEVYSYDRGFDRVPGVTRLEPAATA